MFSIVFKYLSTFLEKIEEPFSEFNDKLPLPSPIHPYYLSFFPMSVCAVCMDTFNRSTRKASTCSFCGMQICRTCLQTYLLNDISDTPPCVNPGCGHGYSREFLDEELTQTFRLQTYKLHREQVLMDRERSKLPATQDDATRYKEALARAAELDKHLTEHRQKLKALLTPEVIQAEEVRRRVYKAMQEVEYKVVREARHARRTDTTTYWEEARAAARAAKPAIIAALYADPAFAELRTKADKLLQTYKTESRRLQALIKPMHEERVLIRRVVDSFGLPHARAGAGGGAGAALAVQAERAAFIMNCPATDCRGFLSTAWKCGLCSLWTCPDCRDVKGPTRDIDHTCDATKVATVKMLNKEAKPCPKCGVQICKIEGCDQMWCTHCNTGFNWRSGKIAAGPVHNPHYFDWLRSQGREPTNNLPGPCNVIEDREVLQALRTTNPTNVRLRAIWQHIRHNQHAYELQNFDNQLRQLRVGFMVGEVTEATWKKRLQQIEKRARFHQSIQQVRSMFANAGLDLMRQLLLPEANSEAVLAQVDSLFKYSDDALKAISKRFNMTATLIIA